MLALLGACTNFVAASAHPHLWQVVPLSSAALRAAKPRWGGLLGIKLKQSALGPPLAEAEQVQPMWAELERQRQDISFEQAVKRSPHPGLRLLLWALTFPKDFLETQIFRHLTLVSGGSVKVATLRSLLELVAVLVRGCAGFRLPVPASVLVVSVPHLHPQPGALLIGLQYVYALG